MANNRRKIRVRFNTRTFHVWQMPWHPSRSLLSTPSIQTHSYTSVHEWFERGKDEARPYLKDLNIVSRLGKVHGSHHAGKPAADDADLELLALGDLRI